jgi:pimeloyl-ACP methyl ester carboxylesterase
MKVIRTPEVLACPPPCPADQLLVIPAAAESRTIPLMVLLVHGLQGSRSGANSTWAKLLPHLANLRPEFDLALFGYKSALARWKTPAEATIDADADVLAGHLKWLTDRHRGGFEFVVLVAHSLGGQLSQRALLKLADPPSHQAIARIAGLITLGTPFLGSTKVWWPATVFSSDARALRALGKESAGTSQKFFRQFDVTAADARRRRMHVPTFAAVGTADVWVAQASAKGSVPESQVGYFPKSHTALCRPTDESDGVLGFVSETLRAMTNAHLTSHRLLKRDPTFSTRKATAADVAAIIVLGNELLGDDDEGDANASGWLKRNPDCLQVVCTRSNGKVVGFFCALPIARSLYERLRQREIGAADITVDDVVEPHQEQGYLYLGAVAAHGKLASAFALRLVDAYLNDRASKLCARLAKPIHVLTKATSRDGLRLVKKYKFKAVHGKSDLNELFEQEFA